MHLEMTVKISMKAKTAIIMSTLVVALVAGINGREIAQILQSIIG